MWCCPTVTDTPGQLDPRRTRLRSGWGFCRLGGHAGRGDADYLRIVKRPEVITTLLAAFNSTNEAGEAVSEVIASGVLPAAIEMMDNLAIQAAEASVHAAIQLRRTAAGGA